VSLVTMPVGNTLPSITLEPGASVAQIARAVNQIKLFLDDVVTDAIGKRELAIADQRTVLLMNVVATLNHAVRELSGPSNIAIPGRPQ